MAAGVTECSPVEFFGKEVLGVLSPDAEERVGGDIINRNLDVRSMLTCRDGCITM